MNEIFKLYANYKKSSYKRIVPTNLEKGDCVYFKVKKKELCESWCEIKTKLGETICLYLATANEKIFSFCFKYFKFRTWNANKQFDFKYFDWLGFGISW